MTSQVQAFLDPFYSADPTSHRLVNHAIVVLERNGPHPRATARGHGHRVEDLEHEAAAAAVGRAYRDQNLFVLDPWRSATLLVTGDKAGQWSRSYRDAIPEAEDLYATYLTEREREPGR
ncbi:DNA-binding protein [Micromonospora sp. NPDC005367]|uniref:DNA-binding protein n=1 Tax=Micromonospora sp. NPDC005367 TaxID=3155590 RepID=UPI00339F4C6A